MSLLRPRFLGRALILWLLLVPAMGTFPIWAQGHESALSDAEIEKLRESAYVPNDRVMIFMAFLDDRGKEIQKLTTGPRRPGREDDLHALFEQFTGIADELNDNLDDYGPKHRDLRKALPKLLQATERWSTTLRTPSDNASYTLSRKLALEAVRDIREETMRLIEEQKTYFALHPPSKDSDKRGSGLEDVIRINLLYSPLVSASLQPIFEEEYRELRPRAPIPPLDIRFRRFTSLNTTIRLREGKLLVRLSDLLEPSPESIHRAIAHILLAKLYRRPIVPAHANRYRRYVSSEAISKQAQQIRQTRGRKNISTAKGQYFDLDEIFEAINLRFFHGLLGRPVLTWSAHVARRMLGHYDAAHNTIVVSRVFDRPETPPCAIEYLLYHEMLHLKHPVRRKAGRRCIHSREFQAEERLFPEFAEAKAYLSRL